MGLFDEEQIPPWFAALYSEFLASYPKSNVEWALRQDKKFWWNLKFYRSQAIELAMKRAASKYSNFPTPQAVVEFLPEGSRTDRSSKEHVETVKSLVLLPKNQEQWNLYRGMLSKEKDLQGKLTDLTWEYQEDLKIKYSRWYREDFWPTYFDAGQRPDPPQTDEERERIRAAHRKWVADLGEKMDIAPEERRVERQREPEFAPPRQERTYDQYRTERSDDEVPFG